MRQDFWNGFFAIGLVVGIAGTIIVSLFAPLAFDWWGGRLPSAQGPTSAHERCVTDMQAATGEASVEAARQWCDLAAQEASARAAIGMERAAWWSMIVTAAGLAFVGMTLTYTRTAAKAAQDSARVALETMVAEQRPWLEIIAFRLSESPPRVSRNGRVQCNIHAQLHNSGRTPANDIGVFIWKFDPEVPLFDQAKILAHMHQRHIWDRATLFTGRDGWHPSQFASIGDWAKVDTTNPGWTSCDLLVLAAYVPPLRTRKLWTARVVSLRFPTPDFSKHEEVELGSFTAQVVPFSDRSIAI